MGNARFKFQKTPSWQLYLVSALARPCLLATFLTLEIWLSQVSLKRDQTKPKGKSPFGLFPYIGCLSSSQRKPCISSCRRYQMVTLLGKFCWNIFKNSISLYSPGWSRTHSIDQADLELRAWHARAKGMYQHTEPNTPLFSERESIMYPGRSQRH